MKKIKLAKRVILISSLLFSIDAFADTKQSFDFLNSDFFSLSKKKENAFDAPSAIYVLSSEDIRRSGATSVPEALRAVPGLQVARVDGNKWAISSRGFNRQYSNKLLLLVDGRTIYNSTFSGAFWDDQDYVLEDIEKIEVIRGPGGTIWGANAVNGIINIITKKASETQGTYISQTIGNIDRSITEARYGNKVGNNSYRLYAKTADRNSFNKLLDGKTNDDGLNHNRAGFRYDNSGSNLSVHGDFYNTESASYFKTLNTGRRNDRDAKGGNLVVNLSGEISEDSSYIFQGYYDYVSTDASVLEIDEKTADVDFQFFHNFSRDNQLSLGGGYRNIKDSFDATSAQTTGGASYIPLVYTPNKRSIDLFTGFIQDKFALISDELYLTIGSKFEKNDLTGFEFQPNARLAYYPSRNQTVWASVSRAVRTPTRGEDTLQIYGAPGFVGQAGDLNGDYEAEDLIAYEFGYRVKPVSDVSIDLSVFYNDYTNLRTFEAGTPNGTPIARNNGYGESFGFELVSKWRVNNDLRLELSYDFMKMNLDYNHRSTELNTNFTTDPLVFNEEQFPQNQLRFRALYNINTNIEFDNMLYYVDSMPRSGVSTSGVNTGVKGVPSYIRWDSRFGYLVNKNLDLSVGIQNILDDNHQEFSNGLFNNKTEVPRTYYVKAVVQF